MGQETPAAVPAAKPAEAASAAPDHSAAYYHYMLARRYRELAGINNRGDFVERAIAEYKEAMQADPDSLFLRVELAELYWRMGRTADAVRDAEAVLKINPNQEDAHRLLANIYWRNLGESQPDKVAKESLGKAIEHFEALSRISPGDNDNYLVLGRLYRLNNQKDKAEAAFRKVLNADPDSRSALASLAQLYFDHGEYAEAIEQLKKIPEGEMEPGLVAMLAYAYSQARDYDDAVATYEKALAQDSDNLEIERAYADALANAGKTEAARTEMQKILKQQPNDGPTHLRLGQLDRQEGRFDEARQELEKAQSSMPDSLEVSYQIVLLEDALGNEDKAIPLLQKLIKDTEKPAGQYTPAEATNHAIFLERLGLIYRTQEKYDQAIEILKQEAALGSEQAERAEALIVETLRLSRQPQKAMEAADSAVAKYPKDQALRLMRATLLGERGRVDEAVEDLRGRLSNGPSDREVYLTIAQIYSQAKRFSDAEAAAEKALSLSTKPDDQEYPRFVLGSIYERQKKYELAEAQFRQVLAADPLNAAACNYLGYMLADRGVRLEESVKYIQKAVQLEPNNGAYLDSLGWAYYKMNRYDLAESHLEKAARLISSDPTIQEHLGHLYLQLGRKQDAERAWERALKNWPDAAGSDFDADQAARLQKHLEELKARLSKEKTAQR
ncbi:MAG: tetratricopeptide repeat protein [Acidobacteriia bacterium]|nr:tetratricopeptide repeat protein [Terriglobia bacterium]